jgi:pre-rRNA-processing protein TSR1
VNATRLFSGADGAPRSVAVIPLCEDVFAKEVASALAETLNVDAEGCPEEGLWKIKFAHLIHSLEARD